MTRTQRSAAHEAGHAVVATLCGLHVLSVRLTCKDPGYYGYTRFRCPESKRYEVGVTLAAGAAADRINQAGDWGSEEDRCLALGAGFSKRDWNHLEALARSLLRGKGKAAWLAITDALMLSDLTGAQVREIVKRYS